MAIQYTYSVDSIKRVLCNFFECTLRLIETLTVVKILATICLIESAEYVEIIGKPRGSDNVRDDLSDNFTDETHQISMNYYLRNNKFTFLNDFLKE